MADHGEVTATIRRSFFQMETTKAGITNRVPVVLLSVFAMQFFLTLQLSKFLDRTMRWIITSLLFFSLQFAYTQLATVRGHVYDRETGDPIEFCTVVLEGTTRGTISDLDGFFHISDVPPGKYTVMATYIGYDSVKTEVNLVAGEVEYVKLLIETSSIQLESIELSARRDERRTEVYISKISVTPEEILAMPSTGGEPDIAQYLQVLPGIISTGDQGGQIYIRGGSPIQNKILLDGMAIYNPFHSIGFFSVFETESIKSVDVLTGGFGAEYGGRISAIVDIKTREGNKSRYGGVVSASPFLGKFLLEGPIVKFDPDKDGSSSFLFTGKHAWIDRTSPELYSYATDSLGLPYKFSDFYGKLSFLGGNGSRLNLFGFNFNDNVNYLGLAEFDWVTSGGGLQFKLVPTQSRLVIDGTIAYSEYDITLLEAEEAPRTSGINGFNAGINFNYFGQDNTFSYGFEVNGFRTELEFRNFVGVTIEQFDNSTEIGGYIKFRQVTGPLIIEPGIRLQYYASLNDFSLEPRFALKYSFSDRVRFKLSGGLYSQNLISTVNDRDIVNLFVGFLSGPDDALNSPGSNQQSNHRLQKAIHGIAGLEIDVGRRLELNIEPYYKSLTQLISINRNKLSAQDPDFVTEEGKAYGIDFSARYENARMYFWATYSLGYVRRNDGEQEYPTNFDRRHNVNLLASYSFGHRQQWEAGLRWNLGSGFPFTLTQGFYGQYNFIEEGIDTDYLTGNPALGIIYSTERNSGRLPHYHRLDISLKRNFEITKHVNLEIIASVTNAYDRENIFYFDRIRYERVDQLPILPSLGAKLSF